MYVCLNCTYQKRVQFLFYHFLFKTVNTLRLNCILYLHYNRDETVAKLLLNKMYDGVRLRNYVEEVYLWLLSLCFRCRHGLQPEFYSVLDVLGDQLIQ